MQVVTSDLRGAGTDAKVTMVMYGSNGNNSGWLSLENSKNNFERNQVQATRVMHHVVLPCPPLPCPAPPHAVCPVMLPCPPCPPLSCPALAVPCLQMDPFHFTPPCPPPPHPTPPLPYLQTDLFHFTLLDLGDITEVDIGHDDSGPSPGWHLQHVVVYDDTAKKSFCFFCDR